jgi:flagellar hook protein FlgE
LIQAGALETSNVDLASQMAALITAQRAFEANGKIITTSDEVLQTLVNLKR